MIQFSIRVADRVASVSAMHESTRDYCADYLCQQDSDYSVVITQAHIDKERALAIREANLEGLPPRQYSDSYLETLALQRQIAENLIRWNTILFHGSVIAVDGTAYLFTATSGTGKSTHTRLWRELFAERAVTVNDDKPFLRIEQGKVTAYGSPWNGKHRLGCNTSAPLGAICILNRGVENTIHKIEPKDALMMLLQQSHRPASMGNVLHYMELVDQLSQSVNFYNLECNMNPEAAVVSYEAMSGVKWRNGYED